MEMSRIRHTRRPRFTKVLTRLDGKLTHVWRDIPLQHIRSGRVILPLEEDFRMCWQNVLVYVGDGATERQGLRMFVHY